MASGSTNISIGFLDEASSKGNYKLNRNWMESKNCAFKNIFFNIENSIKIKIIEKLIKINLWILRSIKTYANWIFRNVCFSGCYVWKRSNFLKLNLYGSKNIVWALDFFDYKVCCKTITQQLEVLKWKI